MKNKWIWLISFWCMVACVAMGMHKIVHVYFPSSPDAVPLYFVAAIAFVFWFNNLNSGGDAP